MIENERADLDRRLRIRRRNLERLEQEARNVEESEAPPAVLGRLQAQIRVEKEEIRLLETQLADGEQHPGSLGSTRSGRRLGPAPKLLLRGILALAATGVFLIVAQTILHVLPHAPETATSNGVPPTHTLSPTYTAAPPTATLAIVPTATETVTATLAITVSGALTVPAGLTGTLPETSTGGVTSSGEPAAAVVPSNAADASRTTTGTLAIVHQDPLNLRSGPNTTYEIKRQLMSGDRLQVTGRNATADWVVVTTEDGETGWVAAEFLTITVSVNAIPVKELTGSGG